MGRLVADLVSVKMQATERGQAGGGLQQALPQRFPQQASTFFPEGHASWSGPGAQLAAVHKGGIVAQQPPAGSQQRSAQSGFARAGMAQHQQSSLLARRHQQSPVHFQTPREFQDQQRRVFQPEDHLRYRARKLRLVVPFLTDFPARRAARYGPMAQAPTRAADHPGGEDLTGLAENLRAGAGEGEGTVAKAPIDRLHDAPQAQSESQ